MIIAVDAEGIIRGALLIECPTDGPSVWSELLGEDAGAIGAVGVAQDVREQGVGTALVAKACEVLRDAGVGNCHIGWTDLLSFYGRLGFRPWREYVRASASW